MDGKISIKVDDPDTPPSHPPPPPPKRLSRPKITLSIPETAIHRGQMTGQIPIMTPRGTPGPMYWNQMRYHGKAPMTPGSHVSDPHGNPYFNPFMHMYHNKASDFMFKQFEGFKDFTMNTAKSGLSAGEKTAFWFYNKLSNLSKKWFTHLFLTLCLALYSVMGAAIFMALEGTHEVKENKNNTSPMNLTEIRRNIAMQIETAMKEDSWTTVSVIEDLIKDYEQNYTECLKHTPKKKMWGFWNSMFYAGTIYTTIGWYSE